jgi:hypothetical protein
MTYLTPSVEEQMEAQLTEQQLTTLEQEAEVFKTLLTELTSRTIIIALVHQRKHASALHGIKMFADSIDGIAACTIACDADVSSAHMSLILDYRNWLCDRIRTGALNIHGKHMCAMYDPTITDSIVWDCKPNSTKEQ